MQFLGESVFIVAIATLLAVLLVYVLLPVFNNLIGKEISVALLTSIKGISILVLLIIIVGLVSGFYPSFILASFNPIEVLKGTLNPGSMSKTLRGILVIFQFSVSIIIKHPPGVIEIVHAEISQFDIETKIAVLIHPAVHIPTRLRITVISWTT